MVQSKDKIADDWIFDKPIKITNTYICGYSSGAIVSANLVTLDDFFDGFGVFSGVAYRSNA